MRRAIATSTAILAATTATDVDAVRRDHWMALAGGDPALADALDAGPLDL